MQYAVYVVIGTEQEATSYRKNLCHNQPEILQGYLKLMPPSPVKSTWPWVELTVIPNNATNLKNICQKS